MDQKKKTILNFSVTSGHNYSVTQHLHVLLFTLQVIYMARNPKDLVVSYYQFHRSLRTMSYRGTFQEFCRRFMNDKRECAFTSETAFLHS